MSSTHAHQRAASFPTSPIDAIGGTPLVPLRRLVPDGAADVWIKLESANPTASYKDRMALAIVEAAEARGDLRPGMTVLECTGGSTGTSLAFICAVKGYAFRVISSDAVAREKLDTMRAFGADLELELSQGGAFTPDLMPRMLARTRALAADANMFWTDQFNNPDAIAGYAPMAQEILDGLGSVDAFCGAVGSAGMLMGVANILKDASPNTRIIAVEPASSPMLSEGRAGSHRVDGVSPGFVPHHLDRAKLDGVRAVPEADARAMARRLACEEGIFAGTSTGLNVVAALAVAQELGAGHRVVTVACDSGLKYLAGDLYKER